MKPKIVIDRNGERLSRKPHKRPTFNERVKCYRRRIGLPAEQHENTFPIFVIRVESVRQS